MYSVTGEQQERVAHAIHLANILRVQSSLDQRLDTHTAMLRQWKAKTSERASERIRENITRENAFISKRLKSTNSVVDNAPHWSFGCDCKTTQESRKLRLEAITRENSVLLSRIEAAKPCVSFHNLNHLECQRRTELDQKLRHARNYRRQMNLRVKPEGFTALARPCTSPVDALIKLINKCFCVVSYSTVDPNGTFISRVYAGIDQRTVDEIAKAHLVQLFEG